MVVINENLNFCIPHHTYSALLHLDVPYLNQRSRKLVRVSRMIATIRTATPMAEDVDRLWWTTIICGETWADLQNMLRVNIFKPGIFCWGDGIRWLDQTSYEFYDMISHWKDIFAIALLTNALVHCKQWCCSYSRPLTSCILPLYWFFLKAPPSLIFHPPMYEFRKIKLYYQLKPNYGIFLSTSIIIHDYSVSIRESIWSWWCRRKHLKVSIYENSIYSCFGAYCLSNLTKFSSLML